MSDGVLLYKGVSNIADNSILPEAASKVRYNTFDELGRIGQNKYAGVFYEEFLPDLQGKRGVEAYKEMSENDDIIGSILFACWSDRWNGVWAHRELRRWMKRHHPS